MKWAAGLFLGSVLLVGGFFGLVILASESGEVITLGTQGADSEWRSTRLWVVDHAGAEWTRTGHPEKLWFRRLVANPSVRLERREERTPRTAVLTRDAELVRAVNEAFRSKYGAADWIVALSGDASHRVVIRLDPQEP